MCVPSENQRSHPTGVSCLPPLNFSDSPPARRRRGIFMRARLDLCPQEPSRRGARSPVVPTHGAPCAWGLLLPLPPVTSDCGRLHSPRMAPETIDPARIRLARRARLPHRPRSLECSSEALEDTDPRRKSALLLIVWNDVATEQREEEKNNAEGRKNIEHGGEISYHAQCVQSVPEYYRSARKMSRSYL